MGDEPLFDFERVVLVGARLRAFSD